MTRVELLPKKATITTDIDENGQDDVVTLEIVGGECGPNDNSLKKSDLLHVFVAMNGGRKKFITGYWHTPCGLFWNFKDVICLNRRVIIDGQTVDGKTDIHEEIPFSSLIEKR